MRPAVGGGGGWMFGGSRRDDRRCAWRRCAREPLAQFRVDTRVIQKVEVVRPCQHEPLLAREGQRSILTRAGRAVGADQEIADHTAQRGWCDGGCYEMVGSTGQKRHFVAAIPEKLVRIAVAPVLVAARAEAQVPSRRSYVC